MSGQAIRFRIFESGQLVSELTALDEVVKIGAAPACQLRLDRAGVGRMHAVIETDREGVLHVVDLGSPSGTMVNGKRIARAPLRDGDRLTIGAVEIEVTITGVDASAGMAVAAKPALTSPLQATAPTLAAPAVAAPAVSAARAFDPQLVADLAAVEDLSRRVVEVVVMWNGSVLKVDHLDAGGGKTRGFAVGEEPSCDFPIPADELTGLTRMELVRVAADGSAEVTIPAGATGDLTLTDGQRTDLARLIASGAAGPSGRITGASCMAIGPGARFKIAIGCWTFLVNSVPAARRFAAPTRLDFSKQIFTGFSLGLHLLFFFLIAFVPPSPEGFALDLSDQNNRFLPYVISASEAKQVRPPDWLEREKPKTADEQGKRHEGPEGQMGDRNAKKTDNRYAVKGPLDNPRPVMARDTVKEMAKEAGILSYLTPQNAPVSPFGAAMAMGSDPENALGAMIGNQPGDNFGYGGLGIFGTGRGGGGDGLGTIGQGNLDTLGHGCRGYNCGKGSANYGKFVKDLGDRRPQGPKVRIITGAIVHGTLTKEQIRRVVHRNIGQIKHCYEKGLMSRPDLEGRVSVKFIINGMGAVQNSGVSGTSLGHSSTEQCIAQAVRRWTFPQPQGGGIVIVTYPFQLTRP